jgi:hypothetical protein
MNPFTKLWTVKMSDWERGLVVAILTTPFTIIYDSVSTGTLTFDWKKIVAAAIAGGIGYILKNFLTGEGGKLLTNKPEAPK